ncbi:Primary amine oxidase precursor [compost metagenome]
MTKKRKMTLLSASAAVLSLNLLLSSTPAMASLSQSGTSLVPVRETAKSIGAEIQWNQATRTITITKDNHVLVLKIGERNATLDGKSVTIDHPVRLVSGHALVSAEFINKMYTEAQVSSDPADLFLAELQSGNGDKAAQYISESLAQSIPAPVLGQVWNNYSTMFGKNQKQTGKTESTTSVHRNVKYTFTADIVPFEITLRLNLDGKIDDLFITTTSVSTYQKPDYDHAATYIEKEVTVGEGKYALPGTLTLPKGDGPFPAVVLIHGSGTHDRDASIGGGKPFRDLAVGLASQGIAVLRYDKITYEHTFKVSAEPEFTLKRESVDDALLAVQLLQDTDAIDPAQIFVAGHSQGGFVMPMVVDNDKDHAIAGAVLLSAPSSKFTTALIEQQKELVNRVKHAGLDSTPYEKQAAQWTALASIVDDPKYTVDNIPDQFPLQPAYWWFEQKNYVPTDLAKKQTLPLLILQGENDWQITMNQYKGWQNALADHKNVEFKSYPKVNHTLAAYNEVSIGSEYYQPYNVSKEIIDDIAEWIKKTK